MDLSKLPKLSDTKSQAPAENPMPPAPQGINYQPYANRQPSIGGDIWFSVVIGIVLMLLGGTFAKFAIAKMTHHPFHTNYTWPDDDPRGRGGQEVDYFDLQGYTAWTDMGIFLFGVTVVFEAAAKAFIVMKPGAMSRYLLMLAIVLTLLAIILNLIAAMKVYSLDVIPTFSALAIAFGGWILFDEWATLQRMNQIIAPAKSPAAG
jgi:cytochrome c oxidase subunit IV